MRYAGGGVGHYRVTLLDTPANANETQEVAVDDDVTADPTRLSNLELEERIQDDNIKDHCSDSDSEGDEDDEENPDGDDLGAEDGEGGCLDAEDDEGYAAL